MLVSVVLASCAARPSTPVTEPVVAAVLDGDTIRVDFGGQVETVRLLGVDTPETTDPNRPVQCFGAEATAFVRELLPPGTPVVLERDVEARDHYGRLLAYVHTPDGVFVNAELLARGYGDLSLYEPNLAHAATLRHRHITAVTGSFGLWGVCGGPDVPIDPPPVGATTG